MAVARAVGLPLLLACAAAFAPAAIPRRGLRVSAIAAEDVAADEAEQLRAEAARLREEVASMEAEVLASRPAPPPPPDDDDDEPFSTAVAPLRWAGPSTWEPPSSLRQNGRRCSGAPAGACSTANPLLIDRFASCPLSNCAVCQFAIVENGDVPGRYLWLTVGAGCCEPFPTVLAGLSQSDSATQRIMAS